VATDHTARAVGEALERLADAATRRRTAAAALLGVTPTDLFALAAVRRAGELSPGALARGLMLSSSGTTAVIRRLSAAGLLARTPGPANQRDVRLRLTAQGEALVTPGAAAWDEDVAALVGALAPDVRAEVEGVLARLADLSERHADRLVTASKGAAAGAGEVPSPVLWG
jgi:DNA-binding MarR family transcriptional regulator